MVYPSKYQPAQVRGLRCADDEKTIPAVAGGEDFTKALA
jgi:hypothetical protein